MVVKTICEVVEWTVKKETTCRCGCGNPITANDEAVKMYTPSQRKQNKAGKGGCLMLAKCYNENNGLMNKSTASDKKSNNCKSHYIRCTVKKVDANGYLIPYGFIVVQNQRNEYVTCEREYYNAQSAGVIIGKVLDCGYKTVMEVDGVEYQLTSKKQYDKLTKTVCNNRVQ